MSSRKNVFLKFRVLVILGVIAGSMVAWGVIRSAINSGGSLAPLGRSAASDRVPHAPANLGPVDSVADESDLSKLTMADVIDLARSVRRSMENSLDDYTARFVKQERDEDGTLGEKTVISMKVQTRLRSWPQGTDDQPAPMRVFLRFEAPESKRGRKVIWGEDLYKGKMAVHETGMLLSLKTLWLAPRGMIAMQGQKHPISEIGMVKLVEKLIERGEEDLDDPHLTITLIPGHPFDGITTELLRVVRSEPSRGKHDFSLAEIVLDPHRQLILQYRSFGWPKENGGEPPLLESYTYEKVQVNVGLNDEDFDVKNPAYGYPAF